MSVTNYGAHTYDWILGDLLQSLIYILSTMFYVTDVVSPDLN